MKLSPSAGQAYSDALAGGVGHTPGPWVADEPNYDKRIVLRAPASGHMIVCSVGNGGCTSDHKPTAIDQTAMAQANARLIAAAPAMYQALKALLDRYHVMGCGDGPEALASAAALRTASPSPESEGGS